MKRLNFFDKVRQFELTCCMDDPVKLKVLCVHLLKLQHREKKHEFGDVTAQSFLCSLATFLKISMTTVSSIFLPANIFPASLQIVRILTEFIQINQSC